MQLKKQFIAGSLMLLSSFAVMAHTSIIDLEKMNAAETSWIYLKLGYQHIIPLGLDHILFVLSLFLLTPAIKPVLWQATAFTVAHTITLGLSMYQVIKPNPAIVEPLIAASILYVALENIFSSKLKAARIGIVFLFGLVHGMGFASALGSLGLPQRSFLTALLTFNIGVELGQITVIAVAYFLLARWFGHKSYYHKLIVNPLSITIAVIAAIWLVQRLFF